MSRNLTPPSAGQPISASFFQELLREVRANRPLPGANTRVHRTPYGTHIDAAGGSSSSSPRLPGCFEYAGTTDEYGNKYYGRPYYMIGSRLYRAQDEDCECGASAGIDYLDVTLDEGNVRAEVLHAADYSQLQAAADDPDHAIIPLYEFNQNGKLVADLRTMPLISAWEFES